MKIKNFIFIKAFFIGCLFIKIFCNTDEMVVFDFHGKKLDDLIQKIAEFKNINILLPQELTKNEVIVNFSTPTLMPLNEIEEYLIYFLSMAGYILTVQDGVFVVTKKNDDLLRRYPLPLYVDVSPDDLPDNIGYIRCIYFLKNLKVQASQSVANILLNIMPEKEKGIMIEPRSNCIIVTGPSNAISAAMTIILEIDQYGIEDEFQFLKLKNSSAPIVAKTLEDIINISKDSTPQGNQVPYNGSTYFSPQIKIVVDARHNGLIFLGKRNAIEKIIEFVENEIDVPLESGKSIIHVYNLKYLDARKVAPILQSLVNGKSTSGQSIKENSSGSQYRSFDNVRIIAEEIVPAKTNSSSGNSEENNKVTLGGNRLIIAASKDDFDVISKIIEDIDRPQSQVIIEIMILDLELDKQNSLGSQSRIPNIFNLPKGIEFQSVMLDNSQVIINDPLYPGTALNDPKTLTPNSTMKSDLLSPIGINSTDSSGDSGGNILSSLADKAGRPGILISLGEQFKNASIASILNLSESIVKRNVIANPYSVTKNNVKTEIKNLSIKRGEGSISNNSSQYGGATVVNIEPYHAELGISITPRVSFNKDDENSSNNRLNLEIEVNVEDFKDSSNTKNFDKLVRNLKTNANMTSGDLLILGGLQKESFTTSTSKVPFFGDIPLIGMLFRKTITAKSSTNLVIILRPTIVENNILKNFSCERESFIRSQLDELALSNIKDPVTKIYLKDKKFKYFEENKESSPCANEPIIVGQENDFIELSKKEKNKINEEINFDEQKAKKIKNLYENLDKITI